MKISDLKKYRKKEWMFVAIALILFSAFFVFRGPIVGLFISEEGLIQYERNISWDIDEFVTALHFKKNDLQQKFENRTSNKADAGDGK